MLRFLFWNLRQRNLLRTVARIALRERVDVVVLAETRTGIAQALDELNRDPRLPIFHATATFCSAISIYSRFPGKFIVPEWESDRISIRRLGLPGFRELIVGSVHLPSRLYVSTESQQAEFFELARAVREVENRREHDRTVLLGDFNANPFAHGMASAAGLNAVMDRDIARRGNRTVQKRSYPFFYNPMWRLMGNDLTGPPGSLFYSRAEDIQYFWHTFDQVLVRPSLLSGFDPKTVTLLKTDGEVDLIDSRGRPKSGTLSDHLPLMFELNIPTEGVADVA